MINSNEGFLRNGKDPVLTVLSAGHALHVFINGQLSGEQQFFGLYNLVNTSYFNYYKVFASGILQLFHFYKV